MMQYVAKANEGLINYYDTPIHHLFLEYSLLDLMGDITGKSVLDMGCGEGHYARMYKANGAAQVVGVDNSAKILLAKRHEELKPLGIEYVETTMVDLHHSSRFDVVSLMLSMHFTTDQQDLVKLCQVAYTHVKPGGRLVAITTPHQPQTPDGFNFIRLGFTMGFVEHLQPAAISELRFFSSLYPDHIPLIAFIRAIQKADIHHSLEKVGFRQIEWRHCSVSPLCTYPLEFWEDVMEIELFQGVTCLKNMHTPEMFNTQTS